MDLEEVWRLSGFLDQKATPHTENYYLCSVCGAPKVFPSNDLPVCSGCGLVDHHFVSDEAEWICGEDDTTNPARCGGVMNDTMYSDSWNMGTKIVSKMQDYSSRKMSRIHFHMSMNHKDRSLFHAYAEIERIARDKLGCSDLIIDDAKIRYKEFTETKLTRGDVRKGIKANCVFLACKKFGYPRTTKEIAEAFDIETKDVGRTAGLFSGESRVTMPADIIVRIFENMNCPIDNKSKRIRECIKLCNAIERNSKLMGKTPSGIASAVVFIVMADCVSKQDVCKSAQISVPTLNKIETTIRHLLKSDASVSV